MITMSKTLSVSIKDDQAFFLKKHKEFSASGLLQKSIEDLMRKEREREAPRRC